MHLSSYQKMGNFVDNYLVHLQETKILDVGAKNVNGTYRNYFFDPHWHYEGTDLVAGENVDFVMTGPYDIPKPNETYDVIISGQTMEHVEWFWEWILELKRLLKHGGLLYITAPGSGPLHDNPDCWRFHPDGMAALADWAGLEVLHTFMTQENEWWDCVLIAKKR